MVKNRREKQTALGGKTCAKPKNPSASGLIIQANELEVVPTAPLSSVTQTPRLGGREVKQSRAEASLGTSGV
jgi:hypothetical protein